MFQSESLLYSCLNIKELLARNRCNIWSLSDINRIWTHNHLSLIKLCCEYLSVWCTWVYVIIMSLNVFQSESILYCCLNLKELLARNMHIIWSLRDSNWIRIHNLIVCKQTLSHLAKLVKWLSVDSLQNSYMTW